MLGRADAADQLARRLGATALHAFVRDVELGVLLAAPGFHQTVPDHPSWEALLAACTRPGVHHGEVVDVTSARLAPATAHVDEDGTVFVFVGESSASIDFGGLALPLLGALFRAEQRAVAAKGEADASKAAAHHASALTAALERSRVDLEQVVHSKLELLREHELLVGIVGHDLRNPLSSIVMGATMLLDHGELSSVQRKIVQRVRSSSNRMTRMIADLLDFQRSRHGGIPIVRSQVALRGVVAQVVDELEVSHPTRNIELRAVGDGSGSWDADRFAQVVSNLVGNAVQHSPVSTPVTVSVIDTGDEVVIEVSNEHTHAIAAEDLSRIFEPFRRGKESGGLGLGLYIVKQIAEAHGGSVAAQSHSERTTFCITLPKSSARV